MAKHGTNWMIGAFVVNHEINQRAQWNRENLSQYNMMYGKLGTQRNNVVFGEAAVTHAKTEYGVSTRIATHSSTITYKLCTQYDHLRGSFTRETIQYEEHMTAEMLQINPTKPDFDALTLTIEEASAKHNVLGGKSYCRCQKDCILVPKCSCIALGKSCRNKCHSSSKKLTHIRCSNCVSTEYATHNVSPKLRKRG
jgi:hypothetical protein